MNTAEKIETIVNCYLWHRTMNGTYGTLVEYAPSRYRVIADGLTVLARVSEIGWHVCFKGMEGIDADLYTAAKMALEEGRAHSVTRNFNLSAWL